MSVMTEANLVERLSLDAAADPGASAALWMLDRHGRWLTGERVEQYVRPIGRTGLRMHWTRLAKVAAWDLTATRQDTAIALAACQVAGRYDPAGPALESLTPYSRQAIFERDRGRCVYCGTADADTIDHIWPRHRGGITAWENCAVACAPCNLAKGCRSLSEMGWSIPWRPAGIDNFGSWGVKRLRKRLGPEGRALQAAARFRREVSEQMLADLTAAVADAARGVLGVADGGPIDAFDRVVLSAAVRQLSPDRPAMAAPTGASVAA